MISRSISSVQNVISNNALQIEKYTNKLSEDLFLLWGDRTFDAQESKYVYKLLELSDKIITAVPSKLALYKRQFDSIIPSSRMKLDSMKGFRDKIIAALKYSNRRSDFYPQYFRSIGIKTCVYCNSQLTVSIDSVDKKNIGRTLVKAKFQVDHYLPKSHYPCFSISLFNLYPVCASCNNCKLDKDIVFSLYKDTVTYPSDFKFILDDISKMRFIGSRNINDLKISFSEPKVAKPGTESFKDLFDIQGIYETQKDVVAEIILKSEVYSDTYKNDLMKKFPKIFKDLGTINQLIIGNYVEESDIHRRPMAKFIQDIAKQLKLIK